MHRRGLAAWDLASARAGVDLGGCNEAGAKPQTTIVTVNIETSDETAFQSLVELSGGSVSRQAVLNSMPVTNSAGETFRLCTRAVLAGQGRADIFAPSPPPPEAPPPEPPMQPPLGANLPATLDLQSFINVTNPGSKALAQLLAASAATVQAAATVAVAAAVGASAAAGAVGGAAGGGGGPSALMGAQRNALYGTLGGVPTDCEAPGATGTGGGWTMGRLGVGGSNPCEGGRRRLAKKSGDEGGEDESLTQQIMASAMIDALIGVCIIIVGCVVIHLLILLWWQCRANRKYYAWQMPASPSFSVAVIKPAGGRIGLELSSRPRSLFPFGDGKVFVARVDESSPLVCGADPLVPGDRILLVNGRSPKSAKNAADTIRMANQVYLLVQPGSVTGRRLKRKQKRARVTPDSPLPRPAKTRIDVDGTSVPNTDVDGDGELSAAELAALDTNGDGKLSEEELSKLGGGGAGSWRVDTDKLPGAMRRRHKKLQAKLGEVRPSFRSLPEPLCWPNLEVTFFAAFSTGLVQASSTVLGTAVAGYKTAPHHLGLAILIVVLVGLGYVNEAYKLHIFFKYHDDVCWQQSEKPQSIAEVDDPLIAAVTKVMKLKPVAREQGSFEAPEEDDEEPARTERMLTRTFAPWRAPSFRNMRPGDAMAEVRNKEDALKPQDCSSHSFTHVLFTRLLHS